MSLLHDMRTLFLAQSSITNLVGTSGVYVDQAPQGADYPYIVLSQISHDPYKHLGSTSGMGSTDVDVDAWSDTEPQAAAVAAVVKTFFKDYSGAAGSSTIHAVLWNDEQSGSVQQSQDGSDTHAFVVTQDYQIQHE